ncbi:uncharacterized protein LOC136038813 isoform X2 [Artemia franciscana]|uniref:uncharacterized protein LOC136038813 isoform X2 n=1 Tax=Artemia franciscana TaxID=6661 RepID=UPI0032DB0027
MAESTDDRSILNCPIPTSVSGVEGYVHAHGNGAPEVRHILLKECDIILECKVCKSLFRSLANFTSHKRFYCKIDYAEVRFQTDSNVDISDTTELVQTEEVLEMVSQRLSDEATSSTSVPTASVKKKTLTRIVDKLLEKRGGVPVEGQSVFKPPINPTESFKKIQEVLANRNSLRLVNSVKLDRVNSNRNAVFQSVNGANINEDNNRLNQDENRIVEVVSSNEVTSNMDTEPPQPSENVDVELTSPKPKKGMDKSMLNEYMEISGTKPKCTKSHHKGGKDLEESLRKVVRNFEWGNQQPLEAYENKSPSTEQRNETCEHCPNGLCEICRQSSLKSEQRKAHELACSSKKLNRERHQSGNGSNGVPFETAQNKGSSIQVRKFYNKAPDAVENEKEIAILSPTAQLLIHDFLKENRCNICHVVFSVTKNAVRHVAIQHVNWRLYACLECDHKFYERYMVERHLDSNHCLRDSSKRWRVLSIAEQDSLLILDPRKDEKSEKPLEISKPERAMRNTHSERSTLAFDRKAIDKQKNSDSVLLPVVDVATTEARKTTVPSPKKGKRKGYFPQKNRLVRSSCSRSGTPTLFEARSRSPMSAKDDTLEKNSLQLPEVNVSLQRLEDMKEYKTPVKQYESLQRPAGSICQETSAKDKQTTETKSEKDDTTLPSLTMVLMKTPAKGEMSTTPYTNNGCSNIRVKGFATIGNHVGLKDSLTVNKGVPTCSSSVPSKASNLKPNFEKATSDSSSGTPNITRFYSRSPKVDKSATSEPGSTVVPPVISVAEGFSPARGVTSLPKVQRLSSSIDLKSKSNHISPSSSSRISRKSLGADKKLFIILPISKKSKEERTKQEISDKNSAKDSVIPHASDNSIDGKASTSSVDNKENKEKQKEMLIASVSEAESTRKRKNSTVIHVAPKKK